MTLMNYRIEKDMHGTAKIATKAPPGIKLWSLLCWESISRNYSDYNIFRVTIIDGLV